MLINFSDPETRYLIDYANIKQGLIKHQNDFLDKKKFNLFLKDKKLGFPLVLPLGIKYFDYTNVKNIFFIKKKLVKKYIFSCKKSDYVGLNIFFKFGNKFCTGVKIKKNYLKIVNKIIKFNKSQIKKINNIKSTGKISSFQTRNIPHLGHELIIRKLLHVNKYVSINPLIGLKKVGDCKNEILKLVFNYLINLKCYKNKVSYNPIICNMHYAGPREALHHCYIREILGFNTFAIGRDHAGAESAYKPLESYNFVKKHKKNLKIKIFFHKGAYFCKKCNKVILKNDCHYNSLQEISGSNFRNSLDKIKMFPYARIELQKYVKNLNLNLFYNK
jgi:sulfate adenylyltransferase